MKSIPFFCSWSGGKDSCLALYRMMQKRGNPSLALTMMIENGERSRSHGIPAQVLQEQARLIGMSIRFCSTSWQLYENRFVHELDAIKKLGMMHGVFGDIDLEDHRKWVEKVCAIGGIQPHLPLWKEKRLDLLNEFIDLGFRAEIVAVKDSCLPSNFLGKTLTHDLIHIFSEMGIDLCGEAGEYHTIVTDGPIFLSPLKILHKKSVLREGYWFSDISLSF
jgi:uncharacterized protein (TIGR00290 family)